MRYLEINIKVYYLDILTDYEKNTWNEVNSKTFQVKNTLVEIISILSSYDGQL